MASAESPQDRDEPKAELSADDAGIIAVLMYNPRLQPEQQQRYLQRIQDEQARQIAAVLMGLAPYRSAPRDVQQAVDRVNTWRRRHGIPPAGGDAAERGSGVNNGSAARLSRRKPR
jgi:hypothetical protein